MKRNLLSRIIFTCQHQFTWPRRDETGAYYQSCVNCGSKYRYDWKQMRRTSLVDEDLPNETRKPHRIQKITWKARERRLRHVVPLQFSVNGGAWMAGFSENLSKSGLLFRSETDVVLGARIEVKLELPEELTGDWSDEVLCRGTVARVNLAPRDGKEPQAFLIACAMEDYDFGRKPIHAANGIAHDVHAKR